MAKNTAASAAEKIAALQEAAVKANNDLLREMKAAGLPVYNGMAFFTSAFRQEQIEGGSFGDFRIIGTNLNGVVLGAEDTKAAQQEAKPVDNTPVVAAPRRFFLDISSRKQSSDRKVTPGTLGKLV